MPPQSRPKCQLCNEEESKYTCSSCLVLYCSVKCYKVHKSSTCTEIKSTPGQDASTSSVGAPEAQQQQNAVQIAVSNDQKLTSHDEEALLEPPRPLRPLTSLRWPYIPEQSSFPDPLERDNPKALSLVQYEAIATSPGIRDVLANNPRLPDILRSVDALKGRDREDALYEILGVSPHENNTGRGFENRSRLGIDDEDSKVLRQLAASVEQAVRGEKQTLGLDWES